MSEEKKYKYLVDVCELAEVTGCDVDTGCSPGDPTFYRVVVKSANKTAWNTFYDMYVRNDDDILFCVQSCSGRGLRLVNMDHRICPIAHTFGLKFIETEYALRSELVKGLKKISSVDEIEQSHGDEPGERGECFGTVVVLDLLEELDVPTPIMHQRGNCIIAEVCCNEKLAEFHRKYDSYTVIFQMKLNDDIRYFTVEREGEVIIDSCLWTLKEIDFPKLTYSPAQFSNPSLVAVERDGDNVSFSVPTATGPRGTYPTMVVSNKEKEKILSKYVLDSYWDNVKQCVDEYLSLDIHKPDYSGFGRLIGENTEKDKLPQLRRARINKPKSI